MNIVYSAQADSSLKNIKLYYRQYSDKTAERILSKILGRIILLERFPLLGKIESGEFRSLIITRRYKAIYRIEGENIYIIDVWDCRQDPEKLKI